MSLSTAAALEGELQVYKIAVFCMWNDLLEA
jgi:hypothetical protein